MSVASVTCLKPGVENKIADSISRQQWDKFRRLAPMAYPPTSSNSFPRVADLITEVDRLLTNSMAPASWSTYENALCQFQSYQIQYGFPNVWPIPVPQICNFIAFLSLRQISSSTITTYVSAISYFHKIKEMSDPTKNVVVSKLLEGNAKICGHLLPSLY